MITELSSISSRDHAAVGGKALNLARLISAKLPVPDGYCIRVEAYRQHVRAPLIQAALKSLEECQAIARQELGFVDAAGLREVIIDAPLNQAIRNEIESYYQRLAGDESCENHPGLVAVRSSATAEDLPEQSFAGQHDSFLSIATLEECLDAVKRCWASLWSERALEYRERNGISHKGVEMAVILQRQIRADAAGVAFTIDPVSGRRDRIVIESVRGLADDLVSGKAVPDRLMLSNPSLTVISQDKANRADEVGGIAAKVSKQHVTVAKPASAAIDEKTARSIADLALQAEKLLRAPLDVEWAITQGKIYLLQARPVTATRPGRVPAERQLWTNTNTGEVLPDVITPMTWSIIEPTVGMLLGNFYRKAGVDATGHPLIGLVAGRAYFNLNTMIGAGQHFPGSKKQSLLELFGGGWDMDGVLENMQFSEHDLPDFGVVWWKKLYALAGLLCYYFTFTPAKGWETIRQIAHQADRLRFLDLSSLSEEDIVETVHSAIQEMTGMTATSDILGMSLGYQSALYRFCDANFDEKGNAVASRLLACTRQNENAEAGLALWELAAKAHDDKAVEQILKLGHDYSHTRRLLSADKQGVEFLASWDAFMRDFGHHTRGELELSNPRWCEQPDLILAQLRTYLDGIGNDDFAARYQKVSQNLGDVINKYRAKLKYPHLRWSFNLQVRKARECGMLRDSMRNQAVRRLTGIRMLLLELGSRLVQRGVIEKREDIFMVRYDELRRVIQPRGGGLSSVINSRLVEYEYNQKLNPPAIVVGSFIPAESSADSLDNTVSVFKGVPANPGVVTGPARVIVDTKSGKVLPGEILVAPFTDPGWTPFFLNAAALVTDLGGILSHGSIVAREYGIPAVVNVGPATKIIKTGQLIQVDGAAGTVRILQDIESSSTSEAI